MKRICLLLMLFATSLYSQQVTVDLKKLDPEVAKILLKEQQKDNVSVTPQNVKEWAEIGKAIGGVIKETAKTINVEANDFAKSDLGKTVMWIVIYHYIGKGWIKFFISTGLFLLMVLLTLYAVRSDLKEDYKVFLIIASAIGDIVFLIAVIVTLINI